MQLSETCIKRPVFTTVLSLMIVALGAIFFTKLEVRGTPNISPPLITVQSSYPGADAFYMERQITQIIEKELKTTKNLETMSSTSSTGSSNVMLMFKLDADIEIALNDVRSKISDIVQSFPDDMKAPSVSKMDADAWPSFWLTITSSNHDELELTRICDNQIKSLLEKLPTVGSSLIFGARNYTMYIEPINTKLYQYKLTTIELEQAIRAQNKDYPAGLIKTDARNFSLKLSGTINTKEEFENIIVKKLSDGSVLKLRDVALVKLESYENDVILRYNGEQSLALGLVKQSTANIIELSDAIKKELPQIQKNLPDGVKINVAYDAAVPVKASITSVYHTIFESIALVSLVIYLFLGSARITLIPLVTIPISLIGTFAIMYMFNFSVNTFTLLAMILAIGLVVDDAIVMLENIFRHTHELGKKPRQAALDASKEIGFAVIAMTITLASVFLPIGFIEGFLGKLFIEFAWTLAFCVIFSGFVALTLTPMMSGRMIVSAHETKPEFLQKFDIYLSKVQDLYLYYLNYAINNKKRFYLICASAVAILLLSFIFVNKTFIPDEDQGFLQVFFLGPEGSNVNDSLKSVIEAEKILATIPEVQGYFDITGWGGGESGMAFVPLKDWSKRKRSHDQIKQELNNRFSVIPGMSIFAISPSALGGGGGGDKAVEFYIQSSMEYSDLDRVSQNFLDEMNKNPVFINNERDFKSSTPTLDIIINREKAYRYGVDFATIGRTIQYLIAGRQVGDFRMGTDIYDVIIRYNTMDRNEPADLKKIHIKNNNNEMLPLEAIADIVETITVKEYSHYNNARSIKLTADLAPGKNLGDAIKEIEKIAEYTIDKNNSKLEYIGQIKQMNESSSDTIITFLFALLFIFLVLSAQFESFGDSLLILMAVPFSITGGVLILLIFGNSINMYSNIGLITLIGLITKNSIMLVEFTNQLRLEGKKIHEAIVQSAKARLRPILMTSIATICGAIPLVLANGAGAGARNSIGLVIVGGMLIGTLFTVFVIPVLYHTFKKEKILAR
ncbi:MAG: efflux RND transporter permease subunit [Rickettsiales bacterium]|nr:MAG: efflux RND transporter permease subunit [Rickettsiales bacterium]